MKYIVYLTTNTKSKINGLNRIYVGVHKTENPEIFDGYLGGGVDINRNRTYMYPKTPFQYAVKKYGCHSFVRNTLFAYDSIEEAYKKAAELVNESFVKQSHTYNITPESYKEYTKAIYQFDLKGSPIKRWDSVYDIADVYGLSIRSIILAVKGKWNLLNCLWSEDISIDIKQFQTKWRKKTYIYDFKGKLIKEFYSNQTCADYLDVSLKSVNEAIKQQMPIKEYYVSDRLVDTFIPKPRTQLIRAIIYVYDKEGNLLGSYKGKEVMPVIGTHSWLKIHNALTINNGWYRNYFISLQEVDKIPEKRNTARKVLVYNLAGHLLDECSSVREAMSKYDLTSSQINKLLKGLSKHPNYIFNYSK